MPAEFIIPNCRIQSNFTFTMASSGDPSSFTFTMDCFPDYTRFDKTKKVLCVLQIAGDVSAANAGTVDYGQPVMPHNTTVEHTDPLDNDSDASNDSQG